MKVRIAYIEEPPFYWKGEDNRPTGSDIELADVVLRAIGVTDIEYHLTRFEEFLPGVQDGRWDMNVPIFVTDERAKDVAFSRPVWALGDGFIVLPGNPKGLVSYESVGVNTDSRLGLVTGQVQVQYANSAGVADSQIVMFKDQPEALAALLAGEIDAFAGTALGNRATAARNPKLEAVAHEASKSGNTPVGAFSFSKDNRDLLQAVNEELRKYLGSPDHRARMAKYGITATEIDGVTVS
jgi:polar amino acid transport system substrate-binding protein